MDNDHDCWICVLSEHNHKLRDNSNNSRNDDNDKQYRLQVNSSRNAYPTDIHERHDNVDRHRHHPTDIHHEHLDQDNNINEHHNHNVDKHIGNHHNFNNVDHNDVDLHLNDNLFINDNHNNIYKHNVYLYDLLADYHNPDHSQHHVDLSNNDDDNLDFNSIVDITGASSHYHHDDSNGDDNSCREGMCNRICCVWFRVGA